MTKIPLISSPAAYAPHTRLTVDFGARTQVWRVVAGLVTALFVALMLMVLSRAILAMIIPDRMALFDVLPAPGTQSDLLLIMLFSFAVITAATAISSLLYHGRGLGQIIGGWRIATAHFLRSMIGLAALFIGLAILPPWGTGLNPIANIPLGTWLMLLPLSLVAVLIQTSSEEILFRGYLQQSLAARFKSPLIWIGIPTVLFALGHYTPSDISGNPVWIILWAGLFGFLAADLTARSGSLGPAMALHFFNNLSAILFVSLPDLMSGLSLYVTPFTMAEMEQDTIMVITEILRTIAAWLAVRLSLRL